MAIRIITFAIDKTTNLVWSRVGSEVAVPILDFEGMGPKSHFAVTYDLEAVNVLSVVSEWRNLRWTKKVSVVWKNLHREFWGFKLLSMTEVEQKDFEAMKRTIRNKRQDDDERRFRLIGS